MEGGTPLFPDLGRYCNEESCKQLDFLPFQCEACHGVFCAEHRSFTHHNCPNANKRDRVVVICPVCSTSVERSFNENLSLTLRKHGESADCDPTKAKKPTTCPVKRCKEILSFQNTYLCKSCGRKTCMKHRFSSDHACGSATGFLVALEKRQGKGKGKEIGNLCGADASPKFVKPRGATLVNAR